MGWLGGFTWVVVLSVVSLVRKELYVGLLGLLVGALAVVAIAAFAPWKHADTPYWRLMLPVYGLLACSLAWAMWAMGGPAAMGLNWWSAFLVLPLLTPFWTVGRRRWSDNDT